jgi:hypothetical protein
MLMATHARLKIIREFTSPASEQGHRFRVLAATRVGNVVLNPSEVCTKVCRCGTQPQRAQRMPSRCAARE